LAALLLRPRRGHINVFFGGVNRLIQKGTTGYVGLLHRLTRWKFAVTLVFVLGLAATWLVYHKVPTSFLPDEDQGYFITVVLAPPGASLDYTTKTMDQASAIIAKNPDVGGVFSVPGFGGGSGSASNQGLMFAVLKDISERKGSAHSAAAIVNAVRGPLLGIGDAIIFPTLPPPIQGLGSYGGFEFELQQTGGSLEELEQVFHQFQQVASQRPELKQLFANFSARDPQYTVQIDREKAKSLGVSFTQITSALQIYMGSEYVNDFEFNNRSYRVYVQADKQFRSQPRDLKQYYVRSDSGQMVPLDNIVAVKESTNAGIISHYNLFRNVDISGSAAPGYSSGQAIAAMENVAARTLPQGYTFSWTGLSLEEIQSGSQSFVLFALGLLVVYLTLSAQYESFVLPFIILLAVPMAMLGALLAQYFRGLENDVYCQIGLVMLIGLASKNAILIVEFAEQLQRKGMSLVDSAIDAARLRLRPILMTSIAFILGVLPLVFATGAGSAGRHSVGTTVFGGMIISTVLNLFIIPVLYVLVRGLLPMSGKEITLTPEEEVQAAD
jgi:HAE1 family hydrophobic/amphiphilic exporter-1